jgi:hypothetical protein
MSFSISSFFFFFCLAGIVTLHRNARVFWIRWVTEYDLIDFEVHVHLLCPNTIQGVCHRLPLILSFPYSCGLDSSGSWPDRMIIAVVCRLAGICFVKVFWSVAAHSMILSITFPLTLYIFAELNGWARSYKFLQKSDHADVCILLLVRTLIRKYRACYLNFSINSN